MATTDKIIVKRIVGPGMTTKQEVYGIVHSDPPPGYLRVYNIYFDPIMGKVMVDYIDDPPTTE